MRTPKRKMVWLLFAALSGSGSVWLGYAPVSLIESTVTAGSARAAPADKRWESAAPGRVESASREIRISSAVLAPIAEVLVGMNDTVAAGDLLVRLDDREPLARLALAEAQVEDARRARDDATQPSAEQVKAADEVAASERAVAAARFALDRLVAAKRAGTASDADVANARSALSRAQERLEQQRLRLHRLKSAPGNPLPSRTEAALAVARAQWTIAQEALEKTRIRAPIAGTVLQVQAKIGEIASPQSPDPLVVLGDRSLLRVRAEVDERDIGKIAIGQRAVVRADAFPGRDFEGRVAAIATIMGPSRVGQRGPQKNSDVEVMEVLLDLADAGLLVVGLRVDVFFKPDKPDR